LDEDDAPATLADAFGEAIDAFDDAGHVVLRCAAAQPLLHVDHEHDVHRPLVSLTARTRPW